MHSCEVWKAEMRWKVSFYAGFCFSPASSHLLEWGLQIMDWVCTFCSSRWSRNSIESLFAGTATPVTGKVGLSWILQCWRWPLDSPLFLLRQGYNPHIDHSTFLLISRSCSRIGSSTLAKIFERTQFPTLRLFLVKIPEKLLFPAPEPQPMLLSLSYLSHLSSPTILPYTGSLCMVFKMVLRWTLTYPLHIYVFLHSLLSTEIELFSSLWADTSLCWFILLPNICITLAHTVGNPMSNIQYGKSIESP